MLHYRLPDGTERAIGEAGEPDGDQSFLVQPDWVLMTAEEYELFIHPAKTPEQIKEEHNAPILLEISNIEAKTLRAIREKFSIDNATAQNAVVLLKQYDDQIAELRGELL